MWGLRLVLLFTATLAVGGCTHVTANTNQLYLVQDYLPLPESAREAAGTSGAGSAGPSRQDGGCLPGPVLARPRKPSARYSAQVLSGMTLRVIQTDYAATARDHSMPVLSEWRWTIPASAIPERCAQGGEAVPGWRREDLLHVRSLLSGASVLNENSQPVPAGYFEQALEPACAGANEVGTTLACAGPTFLDRFVNGLELDTREQGSRHIGDPLGQPGTAFDPSVPASVRSEANAPPAGATGLGRWYSRLHAFQVPADLFGQARQAQRCSGPFVDQDLPGETTRPQDSDVCRFSQTSLEWSAARAADRMPGAALSKVGRLSLLRSGDPLLLFQPQSYVIMLDGGNGMPCNGDPACPLRDRTYQGFADIQLLIPVTIADQRRLVPIGQSVAQLELESGVKVTRIRRSLDWMPSTIQLADGKVVAAGKLAGSGRRVSITLPSDGRLGSGGLAVVAPGDGAGARSPPAREDILFAPGDIVDVEHPRSSRRN